MAQAAKRRHPVPPAPRRGRKHAQADVKAMALVSLHGVTKAELARAVRVLRAKGFRDLRPARLLLSPAAARKVSSVQGASLSATVVGAKHFEAATERDLDRALRAAKERGDVAKQRLLADPEMLSTDEMAERLGMSGEGVRLKRKRHDVLGLDFAKRGIRYPGWQILEDRQLLPALPRLFAVFGNSPWRVYRFLLQSHAQLRGRRALDALKNGRVEDVIAAATSVAAGSFS